MRCSICLLGAAIAMTPAVTRAQYVTKPNPYDPAPVDTSKYDSQTAKAATVAAAAAAAAPSILEEARKGHAIVVIDGIRASEKGVADFDVSRIATIEVLRGAGVVKRYGERGKSGVVVITTKPKGVVTDSAPEVDALTQIYRGD